MYELMRLICENHTGIFAPATSAFTRGWFGFVSRTELRAKVPEHK